MVINLTSHQLLEVYSYEESKLSHTSCFQDLNMFFFYLKCENQRSFLKKVLLICLLLTMVALVATPRLFTSCTEQGLL